MKRLCLLLVFLLGGVLLSCTPAKLIYGTNYDYDIEADFAGLKSYAWLPLAITNRIDPLNAKRFKAAIDENLKAKGINETGTNPDFLIEAKTAALKQMDTTGGPSDYGIYQEGRLTLAFLNPKSKETLWWGETRIRVGPDLTPAEKDLLVHDAVQSVLGNFPPPPSP